MSPRLLEIVYYFLLSLFLVGGGWWLVKHMLTVRDNRRKEAEYRRRIAVKDPTLLPEILAAREIDLDFLIEASRSGRYTGEFGDGTFDVGTDRDYTVRTCIACSARLAEDDEFCRFCTPDLADSMQCVSCGVVPVAIPGYECASCMLGGSDEDCGGDGCGECAQCEAEAFEEHARACGAHQNEDGDWVMGVE